MVLFPDVAVGILALGGGLRIEATGQFPETLVRYAAAAKQGKARLEIVVGNSVMFPQTMERVAAAGGGYVLFDIR